MSIDDLMNSERYIRMQWQEKHFVKHNNSDFMQCNYINNFILHTNKSPKQTQA